MRQAALVAVAVAVALAPAAAGHAFLSSQDPGPGDHLDAAPAQVRMVFTERLEPAFSHAHVTDEAGRRLDVDGGRVPAQEPNVLLVDLAPLPNGTYLVSWSTLSVDKHSAAGNYSFGVGRDASHVAASGEGGIHAHAIGRILFLAGLLCVPGILLVTRLTGVQGKQRREMHAYAAAMGVLAAVGACFVYINAAEPLGAFGGYFLQTASGKLVVATLVAVGAAAAILIRTVSKPRRWHVPAALVLVAAAIACTAATSHGAARTSGAVLGGALDGVHLGAASVWVGGVVGLALWLPHRSGTEAAHAVARFSPWAMGAVAVLVAAGALGASMELRGPRDLWTTLYGGLLLGKMGLAVALVAFGWWNRYRTGPGLASGTVSVQRLRRVVGLEIALMFAVIVLTVVLTATPPTVQGV